MPEVISTVQDKAGSLEADIIEALLGNVMSAVRQSDNPSNLGLVDTSSATDGGEGVGMALKVYQDAGVVPIYDIETGAMSLTSVNMLPAQLRKLNAEGKRMFTHHPPAHSPTKGALMCWLHPEHPDGRRAEYDSIGLPVCRKATIPNAYQVEQHMQHRHPDAYKTLDRLRLDKERAEERGWQREIALAAVNAGKPTISVTTGYPAPASVAVSEQQEYQGLDLSVLPVRSNDASDVPVKRGPFGRPIKTS